MRVLKWLFHPVNIIIVVILFVLFLNRQSLFPEMSGSSEMKQLAKKVDSVAERMGQGGDAAAIAETLPDTGKHVTASPQSESASEAVIAENTENGDKAPLRQDAESDVKRDSTSHVEQQEMQSTPGQTGKRAGHAENPRVLLANARRAAWYGDLPRAIARYKALIAMQPDNYDAYGEMGNVFLAMGDARAAASAYASSAQLLQQAGYSQAAWQLWALVSRLDQQKARTLYRLLIDGDGQEVEGAGGDKGP